MFVSFALVLGLFDMLIKLMSLISNPQSSFTHLVLLLLAISAIALFDIAIAESFEIKYDTLLFCEITFSSLSVQA